MTSNIKYKSGYKYQLIEDHVEPTGIIIAEDVHWLNFLYLDHHGELIIMRGYAWDGPSGPTVDTKNFMRGSLVHDALYQLMREGLISTTWRDHADLLLKQICREDGMSKIRAWYVYRAVNKYAMSAADPKSRKKVLIAP